MNKIFVSIGPITIYWYSVLILSAIIIGYELALNYCKKNNIPETLITDLILGLIISAIIGARAYFVIFKFDSYKNNLIDIFKIWEGGLAIYGGMIMFDDFAVIAREITNNLSFSNIENLHLYRLQDIYVPASVFLDATYKVLAKESDALLSGNEFSVAIENIPTINYEVDKFQYGSQFAKRWGKVKEQSDNISVKLMFGANFLSMMQALV